MVADALGGRGDDCIRACFLEHGARAAWHFSRLARRRGTSSRTVFIRGFGIRFTFLDRSGLRERLCFYIFSYFFWGSWF